jgi:hypothetical protein
MKKHEAFWYLILADGGVLTNQAIKEYEGNSNRKVSGILLMFEIVI